jgi:DNA-binding transcriptional regulator LsrR (DeoR family)
MWVSQRRGRVWRMPAAGGSAQLVLTAAVARRYYVDDASKVDIAEEYSLSRFQVARLLDRARASGLVTITISAPGALDVDLSSRLQRAYGLKHAVVVDTPENDAAALRRDLGTAAAALLTEIVTANDVLGLAWSRSVSAMTNALTHLLPVPVVQLTGALARADVDDSSVDLVRGVGRRFGGPASFFYAPTIVPDASTASALRRVPEVARTLRQFGSVTKAVVGVGLWAPTESTVYDATEEDVRDALHSRGVRAEIAGALVDSAGHPVAAELSERMICPSADQLRAIPEVLAIAYNRVRSPAVKAAVRGGLVDSLVTHASLARTLLEDAEDAQQLQ